MKKLFSTLLMSLPLLGSSQLLYDPTVVYDGPGGLYILDQVKSFELTFYDADYHDSLTQWWFDKNETRLPAELDFGSLHYDSVGVKYKGNSTFYIADLLNNPKVPYNIDINEYVGGQNILGYKKMKLANVFFDPTFCKEALASHIYKNYLPTHEVALCQLTVNGNYLGVYGNTESISKQFLKKHFDEKDGVFFKCEPSAQYGSGETFVSSDLVWRGTDTMDYVVSYEKRSDTGWVQLLDFIYNLNFNSSAIDQYLNVDRLLWYFAVTTVIPNDDAYNTIVMHNYYLYQTGDGKFQIIPWDLSESFCGAMIGQGTHAEHYERDIFYGLSPFLADHPLCYQILSNPYYQRRYLQHIRTIMDEFYDPVYLKNWALDLIALAYTQIQNDNNKLFTMMQLTNNVDVNVNWFTTEIAGIVETVNNRKPYLDAHPEIIKVPPTIVSVNQSIQNPSSTDIVYVSAEVTNADVVYLKVTNNPAVYASDFIPVQMLDDGLNGDAVAGDNIYTAAVPFTTSNDHIKYYIEAENADAMQLEPKRAEYFYFHYYVDQVVNIDETASVEISVYPNPASEQLNIELPNGQFDVELISMEGKRLEYWPGKNGKMTINLNELENGNYILVVSNKEGFREIKKFIKV